MAIYKRGKSWCVRLWHEGKKFEKALGPDRMVAEAVQKELEKERARAVVSGLPWTGLSKIQKSRKIQTFGQAFDAYLKANELDFKPSTFRTYNDLYKSHLGKEFGDTPVSQITKEKIEAFRSKLAVSKGQGGKPLSHTRINNILQPLRTVLNYCVQEGLIPENPAAKVKRLREEEPDIDPLALSELQIALSHVEEYYRPLFTVLAWTGMRPGELKALRWEDVDRKRGEIRITKCIVRGEESTTKTKSSRRVIPIHPNVAEALDIIQARPLTNLKGLIFTSKKGQVLSHHLDDVWRRALKKAGLKHRPSYQLRHTWASMALMAGEDPMWVSKMLGHSNVSITFKHYARFIPSDKHGKSIGQLAVSNPTAQSAAQSAG